MSWVPEREACAVLACSSNHAVGDALVDWSCSCSSAASNARAGTSMPAPRIFGTLCVACFSLRLFIGDAAEMSVRMRKACQVRGKTRAADTSTVLLYTCGLLLLGKQMCCRYNPFPMFLLLRPHVGLGLGCIVLLATFHETRANIGRTQNDFL